MATNKKTSRKKTSKKALDSIENSDEMRKTIGLSEITSSSNSFSKNPFKFIIIIIIIILVIVAFRYKQLFIAGMVDNKPITSWQLNERMRQSYGQQTLDQIVVESLLKSEANKRNITVSDDEINAEFQNVEASLGGLVTLDEALAQQGMTKSDLEDQVRLRLIVTKLVDNNVKVTDEEVDQYIKANKDFTQEDADLEQTRQDIRAYLEEQKANEEIQALINQLKEKANIVTFI